MTKYTKVLYLYSGILLSYKKEHVINRGNMHEFVRLCKIALMYDAGKMKINVTDRKKKMNICLRPGFLWVWVDKETPTTKQE